MATFLLRLSLRANGKPVTVLAEIDGVATLDDLHERLAHADLIRVGEVKSGADRASGAPWRRVHPLLVATHHIVMAGEWRERPPRADDAAHRGADDAAHRGEEAA